jgi:hypothetical protein
MGTMSQASHSTIAGDERRSSYVDELTPLISTSSDVAKSPRPKLSPSVLPQSAPECQDIETARLRHGQADETQDVLDVTPSQRTSILSSIIVLYFGPPLLILGISEGDAC